MQFKMALLDKYKFKFHFFLFSFGLQWNYWGSLGPWLALSHELGHNLNFDHDNSMFTLITLCLPSQQYVYHINNSFNSVTPLKLLAGGDYSKISIFGINKFHSSVIVCSLADLQVPFPSRMCYG